VICLFNFPCPFTFTYFICFQIVATEMTSFYARETVQLLQQATLDFISPHMWPPNSPDLNLVDCTVWGLMQEWEYIVQDTCLRHQRLETAPHWHMGKRTTKRRSMAKAVVCNCRHEDERTPLWISAKLKRALFRATNSLLRKTPRFSSFLLQLFKSK